MKIFRIVINKETHEVGVVFSPTGEKENGFGNTNPTCRAIISLDPVLLNSIIEAAQDALNQDLKEVNPNTPASKMTSELHGLRNKRQEEKAKIEEEKAKTAKGKK